jgi:hypothetical protein
MGLILRQLAAGKFISLLSFAATAFAQTTSFTYQGKLNDGATAANGTYQFQFKLFDQVSSGNQSLEL